jgi:hypothetical protein
MTPNVQQSLRVVVIIIIIIIIIIIETQRMWNVNTRLIPVIIGATGIISKSFRKYVGAIPGNMKLRNYRKLLYWALHTFFGKC